MTAFVSYSHMGFYSLSFSSLKGFDPPLLCIVSEGTSFLKTCFISLQSWSWHQMCLGKMVITEHWCILRHSNIQLGRTVGNLLPRVCSTSTIPCWISTVVPCSAATSHGCRLLSLTHVSSLRNHLLSFEILKFTTTVSYLHLWRCGSSQIIFPFVSQGGLSNL